MCCATQKLAWFVILRERKTSRKLLKAIKIVEARLRLMFLGIVREVSQSLRAESRVVKPPSVVQVVGIDEL
jgi:hypothetical protein